MSYILNKIESIQKDIKDTENSLMKNTRLTFEQCLKEEFLINTQNYPKEFHELFFRKYHRAEQNFKNQSNEDITK